MLVVKIRRMSQVNLADFRRSARIRAGTNLYILSTRLAFEDCGDAVNAVQFSAKGGQMDDANDRTCGHLDGSDQLVRFREMFAQSPSFSAMLQGPEHRFVLAHSAYPQVIGH